MLATAETGSTAARELAVQVLGSVQRKGLQQLYWERPPVPLPEDVHAQREIQVPEIHVPSMFPNLRRLRLWKPVGSSDWVAGLGALKNLVWLELNVKPEEQAAAAAIQLPLLARLTRLVLTVHASAVAHLHLAKLPALSELTLRSAWVSMLEEEGRAALLTDEPVHHLHHLDCGGLGRLSADFAALPGLRSMVLGGRMGWDQPRSIAAATALTWLGLQYGDEGDPEPVALEVLSSLPPSVRCLELTGPWTAQAAALVGDMQGLAGLALRSWAGEGPPLPPQGAPLWAGLRAFSWILDSDEFGGDGPSLPQALEQASKLKTLQALVNSVTVYELDLITSLPALENLILATPTPEGGVTGSSDTCGAAVRRIAQRAMPEVQVLDEQCWQSLGEQCLQCLGEEGWHSRDSRAFFEWALEE
ncbi:hypothetical protein N2152v2_003544 [Parachlorella kessleri]